eukprot:66262-Chlamydomonas_euryale.AAC.6
MALLARQYLYKRWEKALAALSPALMSRLGGLGLVWVAQDHAHWRFLCDSAQPAGSSLCLAALNTDIPSVGSLPV